MGTRSLADAVSADATFLARGQFCDMNDLENSTIHCHTRFQRKRLAGEKIFESPNECFTKQANPAGYCTGAKWGESCSNNGDADCDVDLYCSDKKVCEHAHVEGDYCNDKIKCTSYLLCAWEDGVDYKCRPYGYRANGETLGPGDEDDICRSRYLNDRFVCDKAPKITHSNVRDWPGEKCYYTHGENSVAECGFHSEGKALCKRGAGDMETEWLTVCGACEAVGVVVSETEAQVPRGNSAGPVRHGPSGCE